MVRAGMAVTLALVLVGSQACSRKAPPDIARARAVIEKYLEAQREHRGSHGNFWRGKPKLDRDEAMTHLGVDIGDAPGFEFTVEAAEGGYDPKLRITARGEGDASNVSIACVQDADKTAKPDCKETS